ncbi:MAG TPA: type I polyketide synthase, partial [Candidatus Binatia bacterium]|nr:type I polyketide synthase [Candidatus Binatia bacterium]
MAPNVPMGRLKSIAIIGLDGRFPGADSLEELWLLLREGRNAVTQQKRWDMRLIDFDMLRPGTIISDRLGQIANYDKFDDEFFGFRPGEAASTDPQFRLLLEVAWRALEHGGQLITRRAAKRVGVWVAAGASDYRALAWRQPHKLTPRAAIGTELSMLAHGISQRLGCRGPSMVIDAGCCSVPVAVEYACRSLSDGDVDVAIVGAANLVLDPSSSVALSQAWALSARGECRPFDERADGYVRGEGIAVAVLRTLEDATVDGDPILAIVRACATYHGGHCEDGLTNTLTTVLTRGLVSARVSAAEIDYVEAHAVGSPAHDAAELRALVSVFTNVRLGSLKANIGHLEWASGMASIAKLCAMFKYRKIPPQINLERPIEALSDTVFNVNRTPVGFGGRFAITNSISMGGLCSTVVLEAPPLVRFRKPERLVPHLVALSAPDEERLLRLGAAWASTDLDVRDVAWTTASRRPRLNVRGACIVQDTQSIVARQCTPATGVVWAFAGQGCQRAGMGLELAASCVAFADALEEVGRALSPHLNMSVGELLNHPEIDNTRFSQPAIFALQCALARMWTAWGVRPQVVLGHSVGEI